jgi:uncharacterized protein
MRKPLFFLLALFATTQQALAQTKNFIDQPFIEVSGAADTLVVPNEIYIRIVISERDSRDRVSVEEQELAMLTAFNAMGLNTEQNLSNSDLLSNYKFYLLKQKEVLKSKEYILKVGDAATASKVFVKLEDLDISNVSIHRVDHSQFEALENECRSKAILDARQKALALTKPIGQTIGKAIHIVDAHEGVQISGGRAAVQYSNYTTYDKLESTPKIQFEKIRIVSSVVATFILQ